MTSDQIRKQQMKLKKQLLVESPFNNAMLDIEPRSFMLHLAGPSKF